MCETGSYCSLFLDFLICVDQEDMERKDMENVLKR